VLRILYVEDDATAREYIEKGLTEQGYQVTPAADATSGLALALEAAFDLLILDVMLPDSDGFELLKTLRDKGIDTPAIFLTARSTVTDRIRGLNLGADDYLVKPFAFAELLARISARWRSRATASSAAPTSSSTCAATRSRAAGRRSS
jgi:two-component system copper resistance phosphate regulon response regulator CusR